jgi:hypothetical protein
MPAAPVDGWPIAPCPSQDHGILSPARAGSEPSDHPTHSDGCDPACFLGFSFALAADLDAEVTASNLLVEAGPLVGEASPPLSSADAGGGCARAPPHVA